MSKVYTVEEASKAACAAAARAGLTPREYSGRGMYGASCVAVDGPQYECTEWVRRLPAPLRKSVRWDSMGRDAVAYLGSYSMDTDALLALCPELDES